MGSYILRRLGGGFLSLLLVTIALTLMIHLVPGDPVVRILGPRATPELVAAVRNEMDLDEPLPAQVWLFVTGALRGDLGNDFTTRESVMSQITNVLPNTIILAVSGLLLAVLLGIPLGVLAATHAGSWLDRVTGVASIAFTSLPTYVVGLLLLLLFAVRLDWLPAIGSGDLSDPVDYARHLILPVIALAIGWVGYLARLMRASLLEVLNENYIRTARSWGLRERTVVYRFALKNALIPTVAVLGVGLGYLMGGAIFVELIFTRTGLGTLAQNAIEDRNYPLVRGTTIVIAFLFILANLIADLSYRFLDPRIELDETGGV
jgi:peptide/nickel transport system permease protein